jgi:hypothetical protein
MAAKPAGSQIVVTFQQRWKEVNSVQFAKRAV